MSLFRVENLHARPADSDHGEILRGIDLLVEPGEMYAVIGPDGSDTTTVGSALTAILGPELAILDETDSGLDIDDLRIVAAGIREVRAARPNMGVVLITHYQRLLDEVTPDKPHILVDGRIVAGGGMELAGHLERDGDEAFRSAASPV